MDEIIIKLSYDAGEGYWNIYLYEGDEAYIACEDSGGGVCTSTFENALEMAVDEAKELSRARP